MGRKDSLCQPAPPAFCTQRTAMVAWLRLDHALVAAATAAVAALVLPLGSLALAGQLSELVSWKLLAAAAALYGLYQFVVISCFELRYAPSTDLAGSLCEKKPTHHGPREIGSSLPCPFPDAWYAVSFSSLVRGVEDLPRGVL